jgi:hypothetical protein
MSTKKASKKPPAKGGKREGAGRPSLPNGAAATKRIAVRVKPDEYERVLKDAGEVPLSDWVRSRLGLS